MYNTTMKTILGVIILIILIAACNLSGVFIIGPGRLCLLGVLFLIFMQLKRKKQKNSFETKIYQRFPVLKEDAYSRRLIKKFLWDVEWDCHSQEWQKWVILRLVGNLTLLHVMAGVGNEEATVELLGTQTAPDLNAKDDKGLTPLDYAQKFNETKIIKLLEEYKQ